MHVLVFNSRGELYLQKRSPNKDIQPGKWDTSVGGHVAAGESFECAAYRELEEELGIKEVRITPLYEYTYQSEIESEYIKTYYLLHDGLIEPNPTEITEGKFWLIKCIQQQHQAGLFTPNFLHELDRYSHHTAHRPAPGP